MVLNRGTRPQGIQYNSFRNRPLYIYKYIFILDAQCCLWFGINLSTVIVIDSKTMSNSLGDIVNAI